MFSKVLPSLVTIACLLGAAQTARATDQSRFEGLLKKYAARNSELQAGTFKPKGACVCLSGGSDNADPGFLLWLDDLDGRVFCMVPRPFVNGSYAGSASCIGAWEMLAK